MKHMLVPRNTSGNQDVPRGTRMNTAGGGYPEGAGSDKIKVRYLENENGNE